MAKVIKSQETVDVVDTSRWSRLLGFRIGASLGALWVVVALILKNFAVEPIACKDISDVAAACGSSVSVSGNIAAVVIALIGIYVLVQRLQPRPVVIAVGSAAVLWGLGMLLEGLAWYWVFAAGVVLYSLTYGLLSTIARISNIYVSLGIALAVVVAVRLIVTL